MTSTTHDSSVSRAANPDFDFLIGNWNVHHRRLKECLANCTEWVEFEGTCATQKILDGQGNVDDNVKGPVDPPMVGSFANGEGTFLAEDTFNGRPIRARLRWIDTQSKNPRWEQAFSEDGGATWETNWMMVFTRA